jgi:hypothetical protein
VAPTATAEEIRRAYRDAARQQHPDTAGPGSSNAMAAINEAYFVLSDPGRRAIYDTTLRNRRPVAPSSPYAPEVADDLDDLDGFVPMRHGMARFGVPLPWILVLGALAIIFVFTAYAVRPKASGGKVDGVIEVGSCVTVASVGAVAETGCDQSHVGRVVAIPQPGSYCPDGAEAYVDGGNRVICVRRG